MMKIISIILSLFLVISLHAQQAKSIKEMLNYGSVNVRKPIMVDSVNVNGDKYDLKTLLKTDLSSFVFNNKSTVLKSDTAGFIAFSKPDYGYSLSMFRFYILPDRYGKTDIDVTAPGMFELYVDGKKEGEKTAVEDSLKKAGNVTATLNMEQKLYEVTVKYLANADDKVAPAIKAIVKPAKKDAVMNFDFSLNNKQPVNIESMITGQRASGISLSPDGNFAILKFSTTRDNGVRSSTIRVTNLKTGKIIANYDNSMSDLSWMPKSNLLYYTASGLYGRELRTIDPITMKETVLVQQLPEGAFLWAPDETSLFYSISEKGPIENADIARLLSPDDRQPGWRKRYSIYRYTLQDGLMERITYNYQNVSIQDISADGRDLLFAESIYDLSERPFRKNSLFLLDLNTFAIDTIWNKQPFVSGASFSPDGKQILISGSGDAFNGIGLNILPGQTANMYDVQSFIMNLSDKQVTPITKDFNPSINDANWSRYDGNIYFTCVDRDYVNVYRYKPQSRRFEKLPLSVDVVAGFDLSKTSPVALYIGQSTSYPNQIFVTDLKTNRSRLIANPSESKMNETILGEVKDWNFKSADGTNIEGRFCLPPNFDATKKYPMVVYYYSGTTPTDRSFEHRYSMHLYASQGYVVYTLNPSGAIGYGQEFAARHVNAWGIKTADEIIEGTKLFCKEHDFVDSKKIGCIGASYGGFMTQYLQTRTDIFAAAVSHAGISSLASYWGEGFWGYSYSTAASANSYPWNNPKLYTEQSPLFNADKIKTPLLLLHGSADTNVPVGESIQMYTALKLLGKTVEFVQVEGEDHGIVNFKKRLAWNRSIFAWFAKYLKDQPQWWSDLYPERSL